MKKSQITVREATDADAALLATIGRQTFEDTYAADVSPDDMAALRPVGAVGKPDLPDAP